MSPPTSKQSCSCSLPCALVSSPDVSGGYSPSMFDAIRSAVHASKALGFNQTGGYEALSHHEALYMATVGGAKGSHVTPKFPNHMIADAIDCVNEDCSEKSSVAFF